MVGLGFFGVGCLFLCMCLGFFVGMCCLVCFVGGFPRCIWMELSWIYVIGSGATQDPCSAFREQAKTRIEIKSTQKNTNEEDSSVCNVYQSPCGRIRHLGCQKQLDLSRVGCSFALQKAVTVFLDFDLCAHCDRKADAVSDRIQLPSASLQDNVACRMCWEMRHLPRQRRLI